MLLCYVYNNCLLCSIVLLQVVGSLSSRARLVCDHINALYKFSITIITIGHFYREKCIVDTVSQNNRTATINMT